jgi:DNA-binding CsgD family transcriptional regulator
VAASAGDRTRAAADVAFGWLSLGEPSGWKELERLPSGSVDPLERDHLARGQVNLSDAAMVWGRYDVAEQSLVHAEELARGRSYLRVDDLIRLNRARLDWFTGSWSGLAERAARLADNEDIPAHTRLESLLVAIGLQCATGPDGAARARLEDAWDRALGFPLDSATIETGGMLASRYLEDGRLDDALRVSAEALDMVRRKQLWLWASEVVPVRTSALLAAGRTDEAVALATDFERGIRGRKIRSADAALATCEAAIADSLGDPPAAAAYANACELWDRLPRPYASLLVRERWALHELATGAEEHGLARMSAVFDGLAELGARADAARVLKVLERHGVRRRRPWLGGYAGYGNQLSPRELEVVRLVAEGRTNREVAEVLYRSPHTVSSQLSSAMRKLGVASRRDLVAPPE